MKYLIKAKIEVDGIVDKHDVIGALFGQTEGLLSPELDLRELQDKGRIGRIQVDLKPQNGRIKGEVRIPSNLDKAETALLAALIETVDKVGPYNARVQVTRIIDLRIEKLKKAVERAKEILRTWQGATLPDPRELLKEIELSMKPPEIIEYGPEKLPAGPDVERSDTLIIVEGRADVLNLMRYGYTNTIAIEGAKGKIPETVKKLAEKKKKVIAFLDGDHVGQLLLKELIRSVKVDYIAPTPPGKEVEDLTGREINKALSSPIPVQQYLMEKAEEKKEETIQIEIPDEVIEEAKKLQGTLEALLYDKEWKLIDRVPVRDLYEKIVGSNEGDIHAIIFDGIVTQRIVDAAAAKKIPLLIGARIGSIQKKGDEVTILTMNDIIG
jgi:DNA primase